MAKTINPDSNILAQIIVAYEDGAMLTDLAERYNTSPVSIRNWLVKCDVKLRTASESQAIAKVNEKVCVVCDELFLPTSNRQDTCVTCVPDKSWRMRLRRYGITKIEFGEFVRAQDGKCALCLEPLKMDSTTCVDHCHDSLKVRGVLCRGCNMVVARFEDPDYVARVANYLEGVVLSHG